MKTAVLAMARANGVPVDNVYVFDASRQTTRVSANVSGLFGSAAVRLNDNLLRRASEPEIRAVMGHEIGHYAMNHIPKTLIMVGAVVMFGFLFSQWAMRRLLARYGARWRLHGVADVASLPLLAAVLSGYLFVATPLLNTITRTQEVEADLWGLNPGARTARRSRGAAETGGVPQGRPGADRRVRLLHPPQHAPAHLQRDALARADAGAAVKASGLEDSTPWPGALSTSSRDLH